MGTIEENIESVKRRIANAAARTGRDATDIKLVAVSKTKPVELINQAVNAGMSDFGENRVQELCAKFDEIKGVNWHLIGHLQKNKVRHVVGRACLIHSVDSLELAKEINKRASAQGIIQHILVQVNISGEESKSGVGQQECAGFISDIAKLENVKIDGLMTISVKGMSREQNKDIFSKLAVLAENIDALGIENVSMSELSMGMTHDFEQAVEAGATIVRVGTAIFGERNYNA